MFEEEKKHRRGVCACCDELCKKVHEVHITEEWVELLKQRLPWMTEVPASLRDQYNVAKVDARLSSLASVPLSPRGVICGLGLVLGHFASRARSVSLPSLSLSGFLAHPPHGLKDDLNLTSAYSPIP